MFIGAVELTMYYVYTGNPFDDECVCVTEDKKLAIEVMRKNALWGSYVVDCADHYIAGNYRRYCESFNYNSTISFNVSRETFKRVSFNSRTSDFDSVSGGSTPPTRVSRNSGGNNENRITERKVK